MGSDLPRKVSARKPPSRQSIKEVPKKLVTTLAEAALPKCMVPVKYVTKFTAMPSVVNLSITSPPDIYIHIHIQNMSTWESIETLFLKCIVIKKIGF